MQTIKRLFPAFLSLLATVGCGPDYSDDLDLGKAVATVNGEEISQEFFEEFYIKSISRLGMPDNPSVRHERLQELINQTLLNQEARRRGLDDSLYQAYRDRKEKRSLNRKWIAENVYDQLPDPNSAQLKTAFLRQNKDLYVRQLYFRHEKDAQEYYQRLQKGEDFVDLANELYDIQDYDTLAGWLGKVSYFNVDDAFAEGAWSLDLNEYSKPIRARQGYYIIRVENWDYSPLITEQQFEEKRKKVSYLVKQRIFNLEADDFLKEFMGNLNVEVRTEAVRQVYNKLIQLPDYRNVGTLIPLSQLNDEEAAFIGKMLSPETELLSYTYNGEQRSFTAADYVRWLPELPVGEAKSRTIASVGRALRYEVVAEDAKRKGMLSSTAVAFDRDFPTFFWLSNRLLDSLKQKPVPDLPDDSLRSYFELLRMDEIKNIMADFWVVPVSDLKEAQRVLGEINRGKAPQSYDNYREFKDYNLLDDLELGPHLGRLAGPIRSLMNTKGDHWYVFELTRIETNRKSFEEMKSKVRDLVKRGYNEVALLKELREKATIDIDTAAFNELMEYYDDLPLKNI